MPAIKAYKFKDNIVPVDGARVVKAYQCPWTGRIVANKATYVKHLRGLRETRMHARIRALRMQKTLGDLANQPSWPDVINWVERNSWWFLARAKQSRGALGHDKWPDPEDFWIRITYMDINHRDSVSNSHRCPRGGVTNWGGKDTWPDGSLKPRGYPGWYGRIEYQMSHELPGFSRDLFDGTGIGTGSGGGISQNRYGYGVELFDSDWPVITELMERERVLAVLRDDHAGPEAFRYGKPVYFR
jgi:hypothetical protein